MEILEKCNHKEEIKSNNNPIQRYVVPANILVVIFPDIFLDTAHFHGYPSIVKSCQYYFLNLLYLISTSTVTTMIQTSPSLVHLQWLHNWDPHLHPYLSPNHVLSYGHCGLFEMEIKLPQSFSLKSLLNITIVVRIKAKM